MFSSDNEKYLDINSEEGFDSLFDACFCYEWALQILAHLHMGWRI